MPNTRHVKAKDGTDFYLQIAAFAFDQFVESGVGCVVGSGISLMAWFWAVGHLLRTSLINTAISSAQNAVLALSR